MAATYTANEYTVAMDDGAKVFVRILGGTNEDASKPLLITLHGAPGLIDHGETEPSYAFLADRLRVLVFDARGSGVSDKTGPSTYTHERWIKDIDTIRKWAHADKFVLAGGSYGAFLSLDYALAHGDQLLGLAVSGAWADGWAGAMGALANAVTSKRVTVDVERQVRLWSGTLRDAEDFAASITEIGPIYSPPDEFKKKDETPKGTVVKEQIDALPLTYNFATQNAAFHYNMPRFQVKDRLHEIKCPTVVIAGKYDVVTPLAGNQEIAKAIPNAKLEVFEQSGHITALDDAPRFKSVLSSFLTSINL